MDVDYCMIVVSDSEIVHVRNHLTSLEAVSNYRTIYIVETSRERVSSYERNYLNVHVPHIKPQLHRKGSLLGEPYGFDLASRYDYAVMNCGESDWCVLAHPDVIYYDSRLLDYYESNIDDCVGVAGTCNNVLFIRKEAFVQSPVGFFPIGGAECVRREQDDNGRPSYRIQHFRDTRPCRERLNVVGLDVGELLIVMIQHLGWKYIPPPADWFEMIYHAGGASGYDSNTRLDDLQRASNEEVKKVKPR